MDLFHVWFKRITLPWMCADSFLCDYDNKNLHFFLFFRILADISVLPFWLLSKFGNMVI